MLTRTSRLSGFVALAAVAVLAVGCGGGDDASGAGGASTIDSGATATTESVAVDDTAAVSTTDALAPDTVVEALETVPVVTAVDGDDGACLVGDWKVGEDEMNAYYAALTSTFDSPVSITVVGDAPLSFAADGTYAWAPDFALTLDVIGQRGEGSTGGSVTGTWTAVDGVVTTAANVNALTMVVTVAGTTMDGSDIGNGLLNSSPINGVTYDCEAGAPVLNFMTADPMVTVPVALTPA